MNAVVEKIIANYEQDKRRAAGAVPIDGLPLSYDEITDDWLTAILGAGTPGAKVAAYRLSAADNGTSNRRIIYLEYNQAGIDAGLPGALFCKASHDLANRITLGASGGAHSEVTFYNSIRPRLDIEAPVSYFARLNTETFNSMIMLGDLTGKVTEFCLPSTMMTRERAESQMRLLAKLHGSCHGNPQIRERLSAFPTFKTFFNNTLQFGMREGSQAGFLAAESVIPARLYRRHKDIWPATLAAIDALDHAPLTLAHGDVHLKNWYVAGNGEMGLSDWQCASRGHWARDFAYAIATALTVADRRA